MPTLKEAVATIENPVARVVHPVRPRAVHELSVRAMVSPVKKADPGQLILWPANQAVGPEA
jgi:hypothetical protein